MTTNPNNWPKVGEYWRTRSGEVVGPIELGVTGETIRVNHITWYPDGMGLRNGVKHYNDLVERVKVEPFPHPEPKKITVWLIGNKTQSERLAVFHAATKDSYLHHSDKYYLLAGPITITEGQKDDEQAS